ncbi:hypothetical protein E2605_18845 [Dysgonomonas capnocytophagoides]|uniref:Uncharacterized protein n=1 Tax=Dysgonomonas capnocytophagoides TaxID=45254 RepID=A0A4Y8KSM5_9BACT|nr:hypothetical protein [Dysgonomonas capnocytophagoides]TFD92166.1 hypothetical protein E2605_18845 [Dysgonomonas capnocytophagoides]
MATILKINDGENILEIAPLNKEGILEIWTGSEDDHQSWRNVVLDKKDTENLIKYLQEHLEELS